MSTSNESINNGNNHSSSFVSAMLTDFYQVSMVSVRVPCHADFQAYSYWKLGKHNDESVFDLFFRYVEL